MKITAALMLKAPRPGTVKTRLASTLGDATATAIYRQLASHQLRQIPLTWACSIHFAPDDAENEMQDWLASSAPPKTRFFPQSPGNLGDRLLAAARTDVAYGPVVLMGGDCPQLTTNFLIEVASHLDSADIVLVPALDGGYVLLALKHDCPTLFSDIPWSTNRVLHATLRNAAESGLNVHLTPPCIDIDDAASYLDFTRQNPDFWENIHT